MRLPVILLSAFLLSISAATSRIDAQPAQTFDLAALQQTADRIAAEHLAAGTPAINIAVSRNGEMVFTKGYGKADVETGADATQSTVHRIGSLTKQFTAAAILRLVDQQKLSLDDSVGKFFPDYPARGRGVTIRQLLTHTSGITTAPPDRDPKRRERLKTDFTDAELMELFANQPLAFEPGTKFEYSNAGYMLLGLIVKKITGSEYGTWLERELLRPLGLQQTWYCDPTRIIPGRAAGYERRDGNLVNATYLSMTIPSAAGALCSSASDLARWTDLLHAGRALSPESTRAMLTQAKLTNGQAVPYTFGIRIDRRNRRQTLHHGGSISGFRSFLAHYPADRLTIAVLTNLGTAKADDIEKALAPAAFGIRILDLPVTPQEIALYSGLYTLDFNGKTHEIRITGTNAALHFESPEGKTRLRKQGDHVFITEVDDDMRLVFSVEGGRAVGVTYHSGGRVVGGRRKE
jgi:D-alanyl-D-alanine carboxypeptidase